MNEWKNIIMLFKTPTHVVVCNVGHNTYVLLSRFPLLFWSEWSKITSLFGSYRLLRIAWHDIFSLSHHLLESWNLYIPVLRSRRANTYLLVRLNTWTSQRLLNWNPIPQLTIVLIWKTPACLKFGKTSNRAVENLLQNSESVQRNMGTSPCFYLSCSWRNALWLNAMHCGKKCG